MEALLTFNVSKPSLDRKKKVNISFALYREELMGLIPQFFYSFGYALRKKTGWDFHMFAGGLDHLGKPVFLR